MVARRARLSRMGIVFSVALCLYTIAGEFLPSVASLSYGSGEYAVEGWVWVLLLSFVFGACVRRWWAVGFAAVWAVLLIRMPEAHASSVAFELRTYVAVEVGASATGAALGAFVMSLVSRN